MLTHIGEQLRDTVGIIESKAAYVQVLDRKARRTIYAEAVDPDVYESGTLSPGQRAHLAELGWSDPKTDLLPYDEPAYAAEWRGANLAREWPRSASAPEIVETLARTLAVYGLEASDELEINVFPATV